MSSTIAVDQPRVQEEEPRASGAVVPDDAVALHAVPAPAETREPARIDRPAVRAAVTAMLRALGRDPGTESLAETPRRVADAFAELLTPIDFDATTFANDEGYDELVVVRDIPFHSLCEHHLLPFYGTASIAYLPGDRLIGLSKLPRMLEYCARDLQVQERLTAQVADRLQAVLHPRAVGVVLTAEHECMRLRGVKTAGAATTTSALRGLLRTDRDLRREFLDGLR